MGETLRDKLRRLRREEAAPAAPPRADPLPAEDERAVPPVQGLGERLGRRGERLARHGGRREEARLARKGAREPHAPHSPVPILDLPRTDVPTTCGNPNGIEHDASSGVAARCTRFAADHLHGQLALEEAHAADPATLALLAKDEVLAACSLRDALFLDTETTGLSGGAGTYVFLVGLGSFTETGFELWQGFLDEPASERALLHETAERIRRAPLLVTFFGKAFDRHRLEDKMRLHGIAPPFAGRPHLDLYHPLRRLYARAFVDTRLKTLEQALCGVARADDLPGSFAPAAWFDFLAGRPHRLEGVFAHNRDDVLSLVTLAAHAGRAQDDDVLAEVPVDRTVLSRALALARLHRERRERIDALRYAAWAREHAPRESADRRRAELLEVELLVEVGSLPEARARLAEVPPGSEDARWAQACLVLLGAEWRRSRQAPHSIELERVARVIECTCVGREHARLASRLRALWNRPARS